MIYTPKVRQTFGVYITQERFSIKSQLVSLPKIPEDTPSPFLYPINSTQLNRVTDDTRINSPYAYFDEIAKTSQNDRKTYQNSPFLTFVNL